MPTFSSVKNLLLPETKVARPSTELTYIPDYTFHFTRPWGADRIAFDRNFFLDDCPFIHKGKEPVEITFADGSIFDVNDHNAHYRRLCLLKPEDSDNPKYYLIPWLTIAYNGTTSSGFKPIIDPPKNPTDPTIVKLNVAPYPPSAAWINPKTEASIRAKAAAATAASTPAPQLTLVSSCAPDITARWSATSSEKINEVACIGLQNVEIVIKDATAPYVSHEYIDIVDDLGKVLGRIYLLFLREIICPAVFFDLTKKSANEVTIDMRAVGGADNYLAALNDHYVKTGITFVAAAPTLTSHNKVCKVGTPADLKIYSDFEDFLNPATASHAVAATLSGKFLQGLGESVTSNYLMVFIATDINTRRMLPQKSFNGTPMFATTKGNSLTGHRFVCIYKDEDQTFCHEAGHAFGLWHYFIESDRDMAGSAAEAMVKLNVTDKKGFYKLHDDMNRSNSCTILDSKAPTQGGRTSTQRHFVRFNIDAFPIHTTKNLMDYAYGDSQKVFGSKVEMNQMVKHQIELMRYMIENSYIQINPPDQAK